MEDCLKKDFSKTVSVCMLAVLVSVIVATTYELSLYRVDPYLEPYIHSIWVEGFGFEYIDVYLVGHILLTISLNFCIVFFFMRNRPFLWRGSISLVCSMISVILSLAIFVLILLGSLMPPG